MKEPKYTHRDFALWVKRANSEPSGAPTPPSSQRSYADANVPEYNLRDFAQWVSNAHYGLAADAAFPRHSASPRVRGPGAQQSGLLYMLVHEKGQMVKVGYTRRKSITRMSSYLKVHGLLGTWALVQEWKHDNPRTLERLVHVRLSSFRLSRTAREVFHCTPSDAIHIIEQELKRLPTRNTR